MQHKWRENAFPKLQGHAWDRSAVPKAVHLTVDSHDERRCPWAMVLNFCMRTRWWATHWQAGAGSQVRYVPAREFTYTRNYNRSRNWLYSSPKVISPDATWHKLRKSCGSTFREKLKSEWDWRKVRQPQYLPFRCWHFEHNLGQVFRMYSIPC